MEFYDANSILLPAGAVREGDVEFTLHISSLEPEQLYVFRLTLLDIVCRRFGSCVFLDVNQHFRSREPLTTIYETLVEFEHVLGCENTVPRNGTSQMLFACHLLGFTFRSTAYEILVERHLFWFRHKLCDYDWIREKLDSYSIDGANIKSLVELLEIDVVDSLKNQFCFISLREDILYNYQFLIGQQTTLLPVPDGKLRIGLGVPTTGTLFGDFVDALISRHTLWPLIFRDQLEKR